MSFKKTLLDGGQNSKTFQFDNVRPFSDTKDEYLHTRADKEDKASPHQSQIQNSFHCHSDRPPWADKEKKLAKRKLITTSVVCLIFMVGEVFGGYAAHSLAIMTDAVHLLTDFCSILVSLFSLYISSRPPSKSMTFGWHRSEMLGALLSVLSVWGITAVLVFIAIQRILHDDYEIHSSIMIITSACAVGVNIIMALILYQSPSSHGHGLTHGHNHCTQEAHNHGNASVRAAFIHVVGDLLQSLGVFLAAVIISCWPEYKIADPICTFLFSVFVFATTIAILRDIFRVLMEGAPQEHEFDLMKNALVKLSGVQAVHDLHIWALTLNHTLFSAHLAVEDSANPQQVLMEATELLKSTHGFQSITLQIEPYSSDMAFCTQCLEPMD